MEDYASLWITGNCYRRGGEGSQPYCVGFHPAKENISGTPFIIFWLTRKVYIAFLEKYKQNTRAPSILTIIAEITKQRHAGS